jgi:N utilization substance protein B|tara:strand:- start:7751 stop:8260 length:510 start_codon:yes stop_codon:yes gene_type:complete
MGSRRQARERAVQFLFQFDMNPEKNLKAALEHFWLHQRLEVIELLEGKSSWGEQKKLPPPTVGDLTIQQFAEPMVYGVIENCDSIDRELSNLATNWELHRMAGVDRNILRLAVYEMLHREDIPPVVSINEAVDIAKKFSTDDSGKFVNGILDKMKSKLDRPARAATESG